MSHPTPLDTCSASSSSKRPLHPHDTAGNERAVRGRPRGVSVWFGAVHRRTEFIQTCGPGGVYSRVVPSVLWMTV